MRKQVTFFLSGYRGNAQNAIYPHRILVASIEDMRRVAAFDHVCAEYRNNHRAKDDFIWSNGSMFDLDNTHSDDPAHWKTPDDVRATFPGVPFYAVESRNHMKEKDGKSARPKYHIYLPHNDVTSMVEYTRLKDWVVAAFPYFDLNAKDAARFFFGVENPKVYYYDGTILIDEYLPWSCTPPPETGSGIGQLHEADSVEGKASFSLPDVIPNGSRNDTLHKYAFRLYMMGLNPDEVLALTDRANERCEEPLERDEIITLVSSACKQEHNRRAYIDRIDAILTFSEAAKEQAKAINQTDVICLEDMVEKAPEWLVPGYIPKGEITVMAGDGGTGKTFCWCAIAAAISSGNKCFLLNDAFPDRVSREPQKVMYFSSEDSNEAILRRRLRENGATLKNIITIDSADERFSGVTLNSAYLENLLDAHRPALCIFDPLQSFLPRGVSMIARNEMRGAMAKLHVYGEKYGTTFLIIMHTNKKSDVWGRNRLADSADIWDISRSVLVVGKADSEKTTTRYLSQEKSSYGRENQTVLFRINGNVVGFTSYTDKKDRDFVLAAARNGKEAPARDAAERFILEYLNEHGECAVSDLDDAAKGNLIALKTLRSAKERLKEQNRIIVHSKSNGIGRGAVWYMSLRPTPP